jgi:uncharacterized protein YqfA (UPF0365 family)
LVAVGVLVLIVVGIILFIIVLNFGNLWIKARASGVSIGFSDLIGMWLRGVNSSLIVSNMITSSKAGLHLNRDFLESHFLASGNVPELVRSLIMAFQAGIDVEPRSLAAHILAGGSADSVVHGLIAANRAKLDLDFNASCAINLAGRDIVDAVNTSVDPRVIDCPRGNTAYLSAVAKDGIQLKVRARVTVRTAITRIIGGATDETIVARVGEAIVSAIGSTETYKDVLENPSIISKTALQRGVDAGTAYDILSIDIADVNVGDNISAKLEIDRAEAKTKVAQADAEKRRAEARATQAEQEAHISEMRAKVVEAEAQIPMAMAEAFRNGNLGIMDYYRMKNIQADTEMRSSIGGEPANQ